MRGRSVLRLGALLCCAVMGSSVTGCADAAPAALPDGVAVDVLQGRTDYTSGTLVIRVINESDADLELSRASLSWPGFSGPAVWERGTTVRAGTTVDLRAPVPEVECGGARTTKPTADLTFLDDGRTGTVTVPVSDPLSTLERLHEAGCITAGVDRLATLSVSPPVVEGTGRGAVAVLGLTLVPTGADGRLEVSAVSSTPLLHPDPARYPTTESWPLGLAVDAASGPVVTELRIVPARCDAHAIAEDKVGTVLDLAVRLPDGTTGDYRFIQPDDIREALLTYVRTTCGLG
ncbi:hypothetical protein [Mycetocola sp. 2940]|uniref:hypothetical protein n=1 Tax=Mycetocola sp. 2940 TaxID=3156452 RepID=UPI003397BDFF